MQRPRPARATAAAPSWRRPGRREVGALRGIPVHVPVALHPGEAGRPPEGGANALRRRPRTPPAGRLPQQDAPWMLWEMRTALAELHYLEGYLGTIFDARRPTWGPRPCRSGFPSGSQYC